MKRRFNREKVIKELNKRLGVKLFRLKKIGEHTKLTYGNRYVLNVEITPKEIVVYREKEKTQNNVYLTIKIFDIKEENKQFWHNTIRESIESLSYKRPLYKIQDTKNDTLLVRYGFVNDKCLVETTDYIKDWDGNLEGIDKIWLTDLKDKAENVAKLLNEKTNRVNRYVVLE
jgi:hypothetical protein